MTYLPTHFALAGVFVWATMGEKKRKEFAQKKKGQFLLLNLVAILPDFDMILLIHREGTHSLIGPLLLLIIGIFARRTLAKKNEDAAFYGDMIILAAVFWQLAVVLDLGLGPIAIFWPISNKYYDFSFALETSVRPLGFLPFTISGLNMGVERLSPKEGRLYYVYNWSPEERVARFGPEPIRWNIPDLFLHIVIFIVWIAVVGRKLIPTAVESWVEATKVSEYLLLFRNRLALLAVFIIFLAFVVGPMQGATQIDNKEQIEADLVIGPASFLPGIWIDFSLESTASGTAFVEIDRIEAGNLGLVELSRKEVQDFATVVFEGWNQSRTVSEVTPNATFISQSVSMAADFPANYSNLIESVKSKTKYIASSLNATELGTMNLDPEDSVVLVYVHTWNLSSFQNGPWRVLLTVKTCWDRINDYLLAGFIGAIGVLLLAIPIARHLAKSSPGPS